MKLLKKDKYYLIINEDQLNKEFIYFTYILNGPTDAGSSGGDLGDGSIFEFRKFKEDIGLYKKIQSLYMMNPTKYHNQK